MDSDERSSCLASAAVDENAQRPQATQARELPPRPSVSVAVRWAVPILACGALLVVGARSTMLRSSQDAAPPSPSNGTRPRTFLSLQELQVTKDCTEFFSIGQDCSKKNLWECNENDGTQGFQCCCMHGWGDFKWNDHRAPGTLNSATDKEKCVDMSMPYVGSGVPFKDGQIIISGCTGGNPNKMWSVPLNGQGLIKWASHPKFCLGQKTDGLTLGIMKCEEASPWIVDTQMVDGEPAYTEPHQIKMGYNQGMCLAMGGDDFGTPMTTLPCNPGDKKQLFNLTTPPKPPPFAHSPPIFCIALMMAHGYEHAMLEDQFAKKRGIFECNDYAVYSNESITLQGDGEEIKTTVMGGSLAVAFGGQWHSALNTDVFIKFWGKVVQDSRTWKNTWTIKVDPDAVFFPMRLQEMLRMKWYGGEPPRAVYLNNCHRGLHGPIEVISRKGLEVYKKRWEECKKGEPYKHKQEDFYYRRCWELLNISKVDVYNLLFENLYACDERSDTRDGRHPCFSRQVSFHPFKSAKSWDQCWQRGNAMHWSFPLTMIDEKPGKANFHHA